VKQTKRPKYRVTATPAVGITMKSFPESYEFDVRSGSNKKDVMLMAEGILFRNGWDKKVCTYNVIKVLSE
jgi:hypothetical protein